jgi:hypothetical protein
MDLKSHEWVTAADAWHAFTLTHPELGYPENHWAFHNFLRRYRAALIAVDAIRVAKGRFYIAHLSRFKEAAFACATGQQHAAAAASSLCEP